MSPTKSDNKNIEASSSLSFNQLIILKFIEKVGLYVRQTRIIILGIGIVSMLTFISVWNSQQNGWFDSRVEIHEDQIKWVDFIIKDSIPTFAKDSVELTAKFNNAYDYFYDHSYNRDILYSHYINLRLLESQNILVFKIPLLETYVDINDISLFGGGLFILLYFVLFYSVVLKHNTLQRSFGIINASDNNKELYNLLSLFQVLTIPVYANLEEKNRSIGLILKRIVGKIPDVLIISPIAIQNFVLKYDSDTRAIGNRLNSEMVDASLSIGQHMMWIMVLFAIAVIAVNHRIDLLWKYNTVKF